MTAPFVSGACDSTDGYAEHERCRMIGCECACHRGETYSDQLGRAILGERYLDVPSIERGWPR